MQLIEDSFAADIPLAQDVHVGVVGSGDLEILVTSPTTPGRTTVTVRTSVDGFDTVWRRILARFFERHALEADVNINDFGATPGMVSLRLSQAVDLATSDSSLRNPNPVEGAVPFSELSARDRARALLDPGSFREILGPFERVESSHLPAQGIVPEFDDGAVVARGTLDGEPAAVVSLEGKFQGGGIGEVSGAKVAAVLERALVDAQRSTPTRVVLVLDTGGIRLQEANLGLLAIAEIHSGIVALQEHLPVTAVVAGTVGCFGGMGIAAGLCDHIVMTRGARLGLNGPEVIETEAGAEELDASDRPAVWRMIGGEQRVKSGRAETLVADEVDAVRAAVLAGGTTGRRYERFDLVAADAQRLDPASRPLPAQVHLNFERNQ